MPSVNVSFLGVCTIFQNLPKLVPPDAPPVPPNRVVLVKTTTHINGIFPHIAKLQLVADDFTIDGPPLPPAGPEPNVFLLQGVTLTIANAVAGPLQQTRLGCLPSLQAHLRPPEQLGPPAPLVTIPDPEGTAAWFDVTSGNSWIAYLLKPDPKCDTVPSISILDVETTSAPQLLVTPWDGGAPTTFTLTRTGRPPDINVMNFADGKGVVEDDRDFLLNYLTAATFPPIPSVEIPRENVCTEESPGKYHFPRCGDAGPGCSNTQFP